jgi:hypothetical protein
VVGKDEFHPRGPKSLLGLCVSRRQVQGQPADLVSHIVLAAPAVMSVQENAPVLPLLWSGVNGHRLTLTNDAAYELIMQVAAGELDSVDQIAAILEKSTGSRP